MIVFIRPEKVHICWSFATYETDIQQISNCVIVEVEVSSLGAILIYFVESGLNGEYCHMKLLKYYLFPDMKEISELFIFQNDAPAHTARETGSLIMQEKPEFIELNLWPPNNPDLNLVDNGI